MLITSMNEYIASRDNTLTKISFDAETDENGDMYVVKTKETYVYEDEGMADQMVDSVRQDPLFIGVEKKYKAGKMNKAGECVKPETWTVVAKVAH